MIFPSLLKNILTFVSNFFIIAHVINQVLTWIDNHSWQNLTFLSWLLQKYLQLLTLNIHRHIVKHFLFLTGLSPQEQVKSILIYSQIPSVQNGYEKNKTPHFKMWLGNINNHFTLYLTFYSTIVLINTFCWCVCDYLFACVTLTIFFLLVMWKNLLHIRYFSMKLN